MAGRFKNSKAEIVFAGLAAIGFLERGIRGIFYAQATDLVRGSTPPRHFIGESAVLLGLLYLGFSFIFVGYLLRFSRWKDLIFLGLSVSWLLTGAVILWP